ncbi:MAG: hypothetical protein OEV40_27500 [Acidimicrobiia bacterium]|nr:hypothetical protein [Acidimicrobiia bacterium]
MQQQDPGAAPRVDRAASPSGVLSRACIETVEGYQLEIFDPASHPDLWATYLEGALREYTRFRVTAALPYEELLDGSGVSIGFVVIDDSTPVGGLRVHGPLQEAAQVAALREMAESEGLEALEQHVVQCLEAETVLESKGMWSDYDRADRRAIAECTSRCNVHALRIFNADRALCTSAEHTAGLYEATGAVVIECAGSAPYPDDRYVTRAMEWVAADVPARADPIDYSNICKEVARLASAPAV